MTGFRLLGTCKLIREAANSKSLTAFDYANNKLGFSFDVSKNLRVGVLQENSKQNDEESQYSVAAEYDVNENHKVKAKVDNYGVFGLFYRAVLNRNFRAEANLKSGLNPQYKVNGTLGSNFQVGLKLVYNE